MSCQWVTVHYDVYTDVETRTPSCMHGLMTPMDITGFRYCPYCGNKLEKVSSTEANVEILNSQ